MDIVSPSPAFMGFHNIAAILLGIAALVFALHSAQVRGCLVCCTLSGFCCGLALLLQLAELDRLAQIPDSAAIYDTVHARALAGTLLLLSCFALNLLALLRGRKNSCTHC